MSFLIICFLSVITWFNNSFEDIMCNEILMCLVGRFRQFNIIWHTIKFKIIMVSLSYVQDGLYCMEVLDQRDFFLNVYLTRVRKTQYNIASYQQTRRRVWKLFIFVMTIKICFCLLCRWCFDFLLHVSWRIVRKLNYWCVMPSFDIKWVSLCNTLHALIFWIFIFYVHRLDHLSLPTEK
jgi:hypothetical protein